MHAKFRPFAPSQAEYEAIIGISNANWPDDLSAVESWKHRDRTRDPNFLFRRVVVEVDGQVLAYGSYGQSSWSFLPGKYFLNIEVHPARQKQGLGAALYDHIREQLAERDPLLLVASTREDKPDAIRFIEQRDFTQVMRYPISHLAVDDFDFERYADSEQRLASNGIRIRSVTELARSDADYKRKWYELEWETFRDVPLPEPATKISFEEFCTRFDSPNYESDAHFIALDGDEYVGLTGLWISRADQDKLYTGLTGVLRSHRRKGVATALKVRAAAWARERGAKLIETDNEENNPMFDLNMQLGFEARPAWLDFRKVLREPREGESIPPGSKR